MLNLSCGSRGQLPAELLLLLLDLEIQVVLSVEVLPTLDLFVALSEGEALVNHLDLGLCLGVDFELVTLLSHLLCRLHGQIIA